MRFSADLNRLRAALRGRHGAELVETVRREIERLPAAALVADNSQRYIAANAAALALTGYSATELDGLSVMDLTPTPHASDASGLWEAFIGRGAQRGEYDLIDKSRSARRVRYWAFASVAPGMHISLLVPVDSIEETR